MEAGMNVPQQSAEIPPDELLKQHLVGELRSAEKAITVIERELEISHRRMEQARRVVFSCRAALEVLDSQDQAKSPYPPERDYVDHDERPTTRGY